MREHLDIIHTAGRRMTFALVPACMNFSTVLSLKSRSMCIPQSHNSATVSSLFSLAPWMHNEAYRVHRAMDCKRSHSIFLARRALGNQSRAVPEVLGWKLSWP